MNSELENFPRGGRQIVDKGVGTKRKHEPSLFGIEHHKKVKKLRKDKGVKKDLGSDETWQESLKIQGTLSYNKMQDGMFLLSCVRHISNLALQVEFPGLVYGIVKINQISDTFNNKLSKYFKTENERFYGAELKKIIKIGQFLPAKIQEIKKSEKGHEVYATVNPKCINEDKKHDAIRKGEIIWANVVSELDHGYELTIGINNCRVFLPFKNTDDSKKYDIGEPLYCVVHKVESSDFVTTLTVSAKQQHVSNSQTNDLSLSAVVPGMNVNFVIEEVSSQGIKGQFLDDCVGYINDVEIVLADQNKKLKEGNTIKASVLYVEPITKVTYLTLRELENLERPQFEPGKITSATVLLSSGKGLYLELGKKCIGFVTNKRLINTISHDAQIDIIQTIRSKYPVGSRHDCRILDFNHLQQLYICTLEKQLIKEKIFTVKDLTIGQEIKVTVSKITSKGLLVKTGHVHGFVPNMHLSDVKYTENIKTKFSIGMKVDARVLRFTKDEKVEFTLKQSLVKSKVCLTKVEDMLPTSQYVGYVTATKLAGALIAFYGNVKGWISKKTLNRGNLGHYIDPRDFFFIGQVVKVWKIELKNNKLQLSLNKASEEKPKYKIPVGDYAKGKITTIHSDHIDLEVDKHHIEATIPTAQLSGNLILSKILQATYQPGEELQNLLCINNSEMVPILSRREAIAYKKNALRACKLHELRIHQTLRCWYEETTDSGIYVSAPIKDHQEKIFIGKGNIKNSSGSAFEKHQCVFTKVLKVDSKARKIELSVIPNSSLERNANFVLDSLADVLGDVEHVISLYNKRDNKLTAYKIGARVKCKIRRNDANGDCLVSLPNGAEGIIYSHLKPSNCMIGAIVEGVVLEYNFMDNLVEICGKQNINQKINKVQDGVIDKSLNSFCYTKILLVTKYYAVGVMNDKQCNRQLVYLPLCFMKGTNEEKLKVTICRQVGTKIIALPKKVSLQYEKKIKEKSRNVKKEKSDDTSGEDKDGGFGSSSETAEEICESEIEGNLEENQSSMSCEDEDGGFNSSSEIAEEITDSENNEILQDDENSCTTYNVDKVCNSESILSGAHCFYNMGEDDAKKSDSSEDDEVEPEQTRKKRKLSAAERAEAAKKEEERIAQIERHLADTTTTPQSAEEFDRLLLANPNSSELWLQYISMHVTATELDKARAVGRKAMETINMTLVKEKFNIWIALLNLENMYGTKESFEKLFEEAVRYNDMLDIYLSVIKILGTSGKLTEMEEKIKKLRSKEKQNSRMWLEIGHLYYSLKKIQEARNLKEAALKSILDKRKQFDIVMRFGIMEFQLGDLEHAMSTFEAILDNYPSKVNIWTIYVDQLVKQKQIEHARKVLERAISQKFAPKIMKVLFQKFISFEEQQGTAETVEKVKNLAKEYVANLGTR